MNADREMTPDEARERDAHRKQLEADVADQAMGPYFAAEPEPGPAKMIVVTMPGGRELRYTAPDFGMLNDGTLIIGQRDANGDGIDKITVAASHAPGMWHTVRKDGALITGPDHTAAALRIASLALSEILRRSNDGGDQPFGRPEIGAIADEALGAIFAETDA